MFPFSHSRPSGPGEIVRQPTTWNPNDKSENIQLSNGNLTAIRNSNPTAYSNVRGTNSRPGSGGTQLFQYEINTTSVQGDSAVGIANISATLENSDFGGNANSLAYKPSGTLYFNGYVNDYVGFSDQDIIGFTINSSTGRLSIYKKGIAVTSLVIGQGNWYPSATQRNAGCQYTLNCGQSTFAYPIAGAVPWA